MPHPSRSRTLAGPLAADPTPPVFFAVNPRKERPDKKRRPKAAAAGRQELDEVRATGERLSVTPPQVCREYSTQTCHLIWGQERLHAQGPGSRRWVYKVPDSPAEGAQWDSDGGPFDAPFRAHWAERRGGWRRIGRCC
ncbi:hypothetical protein SKAU_G00398960 [Synaphobranchus kaupii]|uniref:Uncharacterized protein n=1 Tax=Synaphobranchus kaupii TaxID=118154 RepID=A0A9Q1E8P9_SYNKA|nr:hypothetical protein SKAU_G00398960 [Synaphobranchus kaupii]